MQDCYFSVEGDGIDTFEEWEFAQDPTFIVPIPAPTRRFLWVYDRKQIKPGDMVMVKLENGKGEPIQVQKVDGNMLVFAGKGLNNWPMVRGTVVRVLGYLRHGCSTKIEEQIDKLKRKGIIDPEVDELLASTAPVELTPDQRVEQQLIELRQNGRTL